jgi:hypothetical protein
MNKPYTPHTERQGCAEIPAIPPVAVRVADITDETLFPEFALARAWRANKGEVS